MRIQVSKKTREDIRNFSQYEETVNGTINRLLDEVEDEMLQETSFDGVSILIVDETTKDRIKSLAIKSNESYDSILSRALSLTRK